MNCSEYAKLADGNFDLKSISKEFDNLYNTEEEMIPTSKLALPKKELEFMKSIGREWVKTVADYEVFCISTGYGNQFSHRTSLQHQLCFNDVDGTSLCDQESFM